MPATAAGGATGEALDGGAGEGASREQPASRTANAIDIRIIVSLLSLAFDLAPDETEHMRFAVCAVLFASCAPRTPHGAVAAPAATVAIALPTPADPSATPRPPPASARPPERVFNRGTDIVVRKTAPTPPKRFIVKEAKFMGASRDATSFVAETLHGNLLITQHNPGGVKLDDGVLVEPGAFTSDGAFVAVVYQGGLEVYASPSGTKVVDDAAPDPCAVRSIDDHVLLAQEMNTGTMVPEVQLYRVDAAKKTSVALGPKRKSVDACAISIDGATVLVKDYGYANVGSTLTSYDVATGTSTELMTGLEADDKVAVQIAPTADRVCFSDEGSVWCDRLRDRGVERVASFDTKVRRGTSELEFDDTGARMMIRGSEEKPPDRMSLTWDLVDFAAGTVRRVIGATWPTGSVPHLFPGGRLFVVGSSTGVTAIDLDAATKTFVPNRPFYEIQPIPGRPGGVVAGAEPGGGGAMEDLYAFDVP